MRRACHIAGADRAWRLSNFVRRSFRIVMAGLVPAIHELSRGAKNVDARDKPGHDEFVAAPAIVIA
jgi:hypothetical protein